MVRSVIITALALFLFTTSGRIRAENGADMDYGPFLTGSLDRDKATSDAQLEESREQLGLKHTNALAAKAINVRLGDDAAIAFDTDLLRYAAAWTGGFLDLDKTHLTSQKGSAALTPGGALAFRADSSAGWRSIGMEQRRQTPFGPLPKSTAHYKGLYRHGERVIFHYTVHNAQILDSPTAAPAEGGTVITRTLWISPSERHLTLNVGPPTRQRGIRLGEEDEGQKWLKPLALEADRNGMAAFRGNVPADTRWTWRDQNQYILVPAHAESVVMSVLLFLSDLPRTVFHPTKDGQAALTELLKKEDPIPDLQQFTTGGPPLWPEIVTTVGKRADDDKPYVIDTLTLPTENPWKSWIRPTGFDFFSDGRIALCTLSGDVWVVSGIDEKLEKLTWKRYAAGLYEPLGLKVVEDKVYVLGRDQITRLHDLNDDGEADYYENFNNDAVISANYHAFAFDLHTDAAGNFYYTRAGQRVSPDLPNGGCMIRVSRDGSEMEVIAAGLRAANGMGIGPNGQITTADNQGTWVPSARINLIKPGGFYGYMPHAAAAGGPRERHSFDPPLCWVPMSVDNSGGSQVWAGGNWGPLSGRMFHTSYGRASLMLVMTQEIEGAHQGGVIKLPLSFDSGIMRGRVSPKDGQLYLCGMRGWQTAGTQDGTLCRVRYTEKPLYMPVDFRVVKEGIQITFSQPLDQETAEDTGSYGIEQWNYRWSEEYGSPDFSVKDPQKQGRDEVQIELAKLLPDRKTVRLSIHDLKPVMQMRIQVNVDAEDGEAIQEEMYITINHVPQK